MRVPERTLERLRLGELDVEEAKAVLARLDEEEGGGGRLEALIAADESFLDQYPPEMMASRVREDARRSERKRSRESTTRSRTMIRTPMGIALTSAILVAGISGYVLLKEPGDEAVHAESYAETTANADPVLVEREPVEAKTAGPSKPDADERTTNFPLVRWDGRNAAELPLDVGVGDAVELVLEEGEIVTMKSAGYTDIQVENASVIQPSGSDGIVYIEAKKAGTTAMRIWDSANKKHSVFVTVAASLDPEELSTVALAADDPLAACVEEVADALPAKDRGAAKAKLAEGELKVRFLVSPSGHVLRTQVQANTVDAQIASCVVKRVDAWRFPARKAPQTGVRKFAAGASATCQPGEDC